MMIEKIKKIIKKEGIINFLHRKYYTRIKPIKEKTIKTIYFKGNRIKIWVDPKNGYVDRCIYAFGGYEKDILKDVIKYLQKDSIVFDIGANIGQHSIVFSLFSSEVYAFEPNKNVFDQFLDSVKENKINNIHLENYGIGEVDETKELYINPDNVGNSSVFPDIKFEHVPIKIKSLDLFVEKLKKVDFVKVDVEGFELDVILGNKNFFEKFRPKIWLEYNPELYHNSKYNITQLNDFIIENKYEVFSLKKQKNINNILNYNISQDDLLLL